MTIRNLSKLLVGMGVLFLVAVGTAGCVQEIRPAGGRVEVVFSDRDRDLIRSYYQRRHYQQRHYRHRYQYRLPPGLAKKGKIPPGHRKKIERYRTLPSGLEGRGLPYDLRRRLSRLPGNYIRVKVGGDIVLMDVNTRVVLDVLYDID